MLDQIGHRETARLRGAQSLHQLRQSVALAAEEARILNLLAQANFWALDRGKAVEVSSCNEVAGHTTHELEGHATYAIQLVRQVLNSPPRLQELLNPAFREADLAALDLNKDRSSSGMEEKKVKFTLSVIVSSIKELEAVEEVPGIVKSSQRVQNREFPMEYWHTTEVLSYQGELLLAAG